ncbi:MAG: CehA/McbA family metallohydrolase [Deltaproteobacteria bacterium]|nr:CehA/McbA family metallohydrolase [Kofleriaceae bacterium]
MCLFAAACGGDDGPGLEDFYPELPPTGGAQGAWAGEITSANPEELMTGPAAQGQIGDFYIRNEKVRFVVSAPTRLIGVVPQGGNIMDAAEIGPDGTQLLPDHFGELSLIYKAGRTCEHTTMEIVRDGSQGGAAVLRARGRSGNNDFINLKGIGILPVSDDLDPDVPDEFECATTYILQPGARHIEVYWSLFNGGSTRVIGPLGMLNDTGGEVEAWGNGRGFERAGVEALTTLTDPSPIDFVVYQATPGPGYGIIPRFDTPTPSSGFLIAGVSIVLFGADNLLDILDPSTYTLGLDPGAGKLARVDVVVGADAEDTDVVFREVRAAPEPMTEIGGTVSWSAGTSPIVGGRVGVYGDTNGNGQVDEMDKPWSYLDVAADGTYSGKVPTTAGPLLVRAEVKDTSRSSAAAAGASVALTLPAPVKVDYTIVDDATGQPIPGRLLVVGEHPVLPDKGVFETYDRLPGVVRSVHSMRGTTTGASADAPLYLPRGGTYRIYASRGTEWSMASLPFDATADGALTFHLRRVVDTTGYLATEYHVHQVGSPDSPVGSEERIKSAVSAGMELFAMTDHDVVTDLQPLVESLGLENVLRVMPGIEVTPFPYGHFNAWPLEVQPNANGGAIDWGRGREGYAMTPGEIFAAARERGARVVEVNHPRGDSAFTRFQKYFDIAELEYDYENRVMFGDFGGSPTPNSWLRLPEETLWSDSWNALEVWNGFGMDDTDGDARNECTSLDLVLRDWFNMLSMGFYVAPIGNSDTHESVKTPVGMPRTMVRVPDDSGAALASGASMEPVLQAIEGTQAARDIVVTNGPMIAITSGGQPAIGRQVPATAGSITLVATVTAPDWAEFDTIEIFANETPASPRARSSDPVSIVPLKCWTTRQLDTLHAMDPCSLARTAPESMQVQVQTVPGTGNHRFLQAQVTITLTAADIRTIRSGATGTDAWLVLRARGDRAIFPVLTDGVVDAQTLPVLVSGTAQDVDLVLRGRGVFAMAFSAPVFLDFDGNGYRAPFEP